MHIYLVTVRLLSEQFSRMRKKLWLSFLLWPMGCLASGWDCENTALAASYDCWKKPWYLWSAFGEIYSITEQFICIVITLPGTYNSVSKDNCAFQEIKAKYLEVKWHKHGFSVENTARAATIQ